MNAVMRLDSHPELNVGGVQLAQHLKDTRATVPRVPGINTKIRPITMLATAKFLRRDEVADLVVMQAIPHRCDPEVPSLTHSYYLLSRHRELAEIQDAEWPDTYCPLKPGSYDLLFDVLDEYIDVMKPKRGPCRS